MSNVNYLKKRSGRRNQPKPMKTTGEFYGQAVAACVVNSGV